jgi:hypothetical protein
MDSARALAVVRSLANGVDPESGEVFTAESPYYAGLTEEKGLGGSYR